MTKKVEQDSTSDAGQDCSESHQRAGVPTENELEMLCSVGFSVSAAETCKRPVWSRLYY